MKYFIITKKHIYLALLLLFFIISVIITSSVINSKRATTAFGVKDMTDTVSEQLPTSDGLPSVKDILKKVLGFSVDQPDTVVENFSSMFYSADPEVSDQAKEPNETAAPSPSINADPTPQPTKITVSEKKISESFKISNGTKYELNINDFANEKLTFPKKATVLIVHTHTTECYAPEEGQYVQNDNGRSLDNMKNVVRIGDIIKTELENCGISVIHDTTVHDYPSYQGAYGRSLTTIKKNIEQNQNICIVLDIHRDAIVKNDGTRIKLATDINGEKIAQLMLVAGTDGGGLTHPKWQQNLNFAIKIQQKACKEFDGLMRPIDLREERFNQHLTTGSLIVEVGTTGNTLLEAENGARLFGNVLSEVIIEAQK